MRTLLSMALLCSAAGCARGDNRITQDESRVWNFYNDGKDYISVRHVATLAFDAPGKKLRVLLPTAGSTDDSGASRATGFFSIVLPVESPCTLSVHKFDAEVRAQFVVTPDVANASQTSYASKDGVVAISAFSAEELEFGFEFDALKDSSSTAAAEFKGAIYLRQSIPGCQGL